MAITDVIKYEGDNSTFIWKHPTEDFNKLTQLIVHESQEAIFFMNGQALDSFGPGRYTLETDLIPIIGKLYSHLLTGKESAFHSEVYFINKTVQMGMKWGTDSKVRYIDPESGVPLELGACGEMNLSVSDGRKLLLKLVGTMNGIAWGENGTGFTKSLQQAFRPMISTAVKTNLTPAIKFGGFDILEIDEHLTELSGVLKGKIQPGFEEYGLTIPQFYVTNIVLPEDDPNFRRIRELHTISLQKRMLYAEAEVKTTQAQTEADVTAARRAVEMERQTTQTEVLKREQERELLQAQVEAQKKRMESAANADALKMEGFAEAEVMAAKGYNQKDVLQADVQKAFAQGLGQMGANGGSGGGSVMGDILGLGMGLKAAGAMAGQMDGLFAGFDKGPQQSQPVSMQAGAAASGDGKAAAVCAKCGAALPPNAKFCLECGTKVETLAENEMICPVCGKKTPKGKFCMECGAPLVSKCPNCGAEVPQGAKFCLECGTKM